MHTNIVICAQICVSDNIAKVVSYTRASSLKVV